MSSFNPDPATTNAIFVPTSFADPSDGFVPGLTAGDRSASDERARLGAAADPAAAETSEVAEEAVPESRTLTLVEIEELEQAAFARGFESAGELTERLEGLCDGLEGARKELSNQGASLLSANRTLLMELATEIATTWVGQEMQTSGEVLLRCIDRVIDSIEDAAPLRLLLSSADRALLESTVPERLQAWADRDAFEVATDDSLSAGGFRVEQANRVFDGSSNAILDRLRETLLEALDAGPPQESAP